MLLGWGNKFSRVKPGDDTWTSRCRRRNGVVERRRRGWQRLLLHQRATFKSIILKWRREHTKWLISIIYALVSPCSHLFQPPSFPSSLQCRVSHCFSRPLLIKDSPSPLSATTNPGGRFFVFRSTLTASSLLAFLWIRLSRDFLLRRRETLPFLFLFRNRIDF